MTLKWTPQTEQAALEDWIDSHRPSGDVDQVQRAWVESGAYAEWLDEQDPPKPMVAFTMDSDVDAVVRWLSRDITTTLHSAPAPVPLQRVAPLGVLCMREMDHRLGDFSGATREGGL